MLQHLKEDWRHLKHGEPGQRFKDRYYLSQRRNRGRFTFWRVFNLGVGSGIALAGLLMVIAPGPGWLAIFLEQLAMSLVYKSSYTYGCLFRRSQTEDSPSLTAATDEQERGRPRFRG